MITNDGILSSNNEYEGANDFNNLSEDFTGYKFFEKKRYKSEHSILFWVSSLIMSLVVIDFESKKRCCFKPLFKKLLKRENGMQEAEHEVAKDYYELMNAKALTDEYKRTKRYYEILTSQHQLNSVSNSVERGIQKIPERHKERIQKKLKTIETVIFDKFNRISSADSSVQALDNEFLDLFCQKFTIAEQIHDKYLSTKVQSYDIRDSFKYSNLLQLEEFLLNQANFEQ